VFTGPAIQRATAQTLTDSVTVNATAGLGTIGSDAIGLNTAVYDGYMNDTPIPGLLRAAGIGALRYPGGSYSDIYNWQTNTAQGGYVAPGNSFSSFMTTAKAVGAEPIITVNYGTGTPALAAAWVSSAQSSGDGVKYWEVGNEAYGNGTYGANWEAYSHCDTSPSGGPVTIGSEPSQTYNCGPATYASNVAQYITAMHAANANAKVCSWQLTFSFPASGEAVQGGWDGTWSQSGQQVTVTAASWNSTIAAGGGSVSIGFNGTDTGQDPAPTAFYINGTVCAND
jgi:Cellulose binding domain